MTENVEFIEPHYLNFNFSENYLSNEDTKLWIELPYPITKPSKKSSDFIRNHHETVENYYEKLKLLHKDSVPDRIIKQNFRNKYLTITKGLLDCCNEKRLEISYRTDYHPYYSTNLLETFDLNGKQYLIRPIRNNNLGYVKLDKRYKSKKLKIDANFQDKIRGISIDNRQDYVNLLLRFNNDLKLLKIDDINDNCSIGYSRQFEQQILDCKLQRNRLGVVLDDGFVEIFDINNNKQLHRLTIENPIKCDFNSNNFTILNRDCLQLIDAKSGDNQSFKPNLNKCDSFCSFLIDDYSIYIGSRHCLLRTDLRRLDQYEYCSHMMQNSPCYIDLNKTDTMTVLCLSNQKSNEKVLFNGEPINSLPKNVPNIDETFEMYLKQNSPKLCDDFNERLQYSTVGIKLLCEENMLNLYSCNVLGDIFKQSISTSQRICPDNASNIFKDWIDKVPVIESKLYLTNFVNLSDLYFTLNDNLVKGSFKNHNVRNKKCDRFLKKFECLYDSDNLKLLADNFAALWNDVGDDDRKVDNVPEVAAYDKVTSWIESNYFIDDDDDDDELKYL